MRGGKNSGSGFGFLVVLQRLEFKHVEAVKSVPTIPFLWYNKEIIFSNFMEITNRQLIELIDFSPSLNFKAKVKWRSYVPYLKGDDRERLYKVLSDEKKDVTKVLKEKMKGFRGYFFAKGLESLEQEFMKKYQ